MNYKNLIVFSVVVGAILGSSFGLLLYVAPIDEQKRIHEQSLVKNCIPVGPDENISSIVIGNYTHIFNLRTCQWNEYIDPSN